MALTEKANFLDLKRTILLSNPQTKNKCLSLGRQKNKRKKKLKKLPNISKFGTRKQQLLGCL
jgi:hypothetical protein